MRLSTSHRAHQPSPIPTRSPEEEAAIREHHREEFDAGLDSVDDTPDDEPLETSAALRDAMVFAAGLATADTLGDVV